MRKIINRYIFKEIAFPFIIILLVLTFVLLMGKIMQIMDLVINKGVSAFSIAKIIVFLLPSFMLFTIPIALLIAILIAMGRLSADNEITAIKTSGISLMQIFYPVAIASLITFVLAVFISYFLVPQSNFATKRLLFNIAQQNASIGIKEKVFNSDFKDFLIYAEKIPVNQNYMEGVIISDNRMIGEQNTILAKRAILVSDSESMTVKLKLEDGSIHTVSSDLKNYRKIDFTSYEINLDLSTALANLDESSKTSTEMTVSELLEKMNKPGLDPAAIRELAIEVHKKFSIPLSCLFFGLLALPLGIRSHRSVKSRGFAVGLIVVASYYLLRIGGEALVETGYLSPVIGVWAPNFLFALVGICLLYAANREISFIPIATIFRKSGLKNS
ncbi:MAG: LPS export ABC transporter permease LptF [Deltaproteobacteria bacterium HGW-Deltaproteobacteria-10]|nr:MAG: LPS export ABC transporter permease LptF [Deltaproteobacteria bacterium HGW-Deltaproteobacteria-10]